MVQQKVPSHSAEDFFGAPSGTRTQDPLIKSQLLSLMTRTKTVISKYSSTETVDSAVPEWHAFSAMMLARTHLPR